MINAAFSQTGIKQIIVGVSLFTTSVQSQIVPSLLGSITEHVVDVTKKSSRLQVIDLTSGAARNEALKKAQEIIRQTIKNY